MATCLPRSLGASRRTSRLAPSSDPVCIESVGTGTDGLNLAACHACVLAPETFCEEQNVLLDRALLYGTPDDLPDAGFFSAFAFSAL